MANRPLDDSLRFARDQVPAGRTICDFLLRLAFLAQPTRRIKSVPTVLPVLGQLGEIISNDLQDLLGQHIWCETGDLRQR